MSGYVTLMGAEQVQRAGHNMQDAAERMSRAASQMSETMDRLQRVLEDNRQSFEALVERLEKLNLAPEPEKKVWGGHEGPVGDF